MNIMANTHLCILAALAVAFYYKGLPAMHGYRTRATKSMAHRTLVRRQWEPQLQRNIARQRQKEPEDEDRRLQQLAEDVISGSKGIKKKSKFYKESLYEPYWVGGEWVYYRTTPVLKKKYTKPPSTTTPWSSTSSETTTTTMETVTTAYVNYMCQHPCLEIFEDFGVVCGQRYNGRWYEQRQFEDACDLINANCVDPRSTRYWYDRWMWYRGPWYLLYRGPCWNLTTPWPFPPTNMEALISRNRFYVSRVLHNIDWDLNSVRPTRDGVNISTLET